MAEQELLFELYLVRHGQSQGNAGYKDCDPTEDERFDPRLTKMGNDQAWLLGRRFSDFPFDYILASPYYRALGTGYAVMKEQPENGCHKVEIHPLFCECGTTTYEGKTIERIQEDFPFAEPAIGAQNYTHFMYGDKTAEDSERRERADKMIAYLKERFHNGEKVLVAAHACFNTFLIFSALGLGDGLKFDFANGNTGVTKLLFYKEGTGKYADTVLVYHNDQSHLFHEYRGIHLDET